MEWRGLRPIAMTIAIESEYLIVLVEISEEETKEQQ